EIMPTAKKVGEARFKVFLFKIYDAELFAPDGRFDRKGPYALRLNYLLDAKKDRIISSTVKEMKRQKAASSKVIEGWVPLMEDAFISMDKGSYADFIHTGDGRVLLTANGKLISEITDSRFITALMNVWLGPKVRDKEFQDKLMGRVK
ncbi:MAG: chalcone isomerase family protein, partial [Pseudomonadota bacterium]|nr:chalcone isomerase family protein [Pseudomonadota bacterium]